MLPKVTIHNQISLDGSITGFEADLDIYYGIAAGMGSDAVLVGSDTIITAVPQIPPEEDSDRVKPTISPDDTTPYMVVPDSRGRVRCHHVFRKLPYIRDVIVLISETTQDEYIEYLKEREYDHIVCGEDHVDYRKAFKILNERYGIESLRSDSGEILNSILIKEGLVDEISLIVTPILAGTGSVKLFGKLDIDGTIPLKMLECREIERGLIHISYGITGVEKS